MNLGRTLHLEHIRSNFNRLDVGCDTVGGKLKIKASISGETNWINVSQDQLVFIRAILQLNGPAVEEYLQDLLVRHSYTLSGVDTQC